MDDKANAGDKDRKKRQGIRKSNRSATMSKEQPSHAFQTQEPLSCTVFPKARIANPCWCHWSIQGSPLSIWHQGRPWAAAYSVLVNGNNIWELLSWKEKPSHLHLHGRHSALLSWPPELSREECSWKKENKHISLSVLECGFLHN